MSKVLIDPTKPIVISVGGAFLVPNSGINTKFLINLNALIRKYVASGHRFFLVAGGGRTARQYRDAGKAVNHHMSNHDLDWLGIHATRLNGHLLRTIFEDIAHPRMIENYHHRLENWTESIVIGAGWKPGWSTDYCAVYLAYEYKAAPVINLTNVDYIYDSDPKTNPHAHALHTATWKQMESIVGTTWTPGMNAPFDPIASQLAAEHDIDVIVTNGDNLENLENILCNKPYRGTLITK
ncbi:MAG: UMP kinase [Candidatus Roizmanbacteria bacterium]